MKRRRTVTLLSTLVLTGASILTFISVMGRPKVLDGTSVSTLQAGSLGISKMIDVGDTQPLDLRYVIFDSSQVDLRIVEQPKREGAKLLHDVLRPTEAFAGCNGGYFHATGDFSPTDLQICDGARTGTLAQGEHTGTVSVRAGKILLEWADEFRDDGAIQQLVQCNPWLIKAGKTFPESHDEPRHRRTFIATDEQGKWCIGCTSAIELGLLARLLADPKIIPELTICRALNLDGGPSSGIWWRQSDGKDGGLPQAGSVVRNFVVLFPKTKP
jgi:hypothetical protein